jgi:acyl-coenzyme A thioesterase PaaI-like protein
MAMTARMELRHRSPARAGDLLKVEARCVKESRRIADIEGHISTAGRTVAEASARFVKVGDFDPEAVFLQAP